MGITAGNRNVGGLVLGGATGRAVEDLLLFIGVYQIPMYLTPLLLTGWSRRMARRNELGWLACPALRNSARATRVFVLC